MSSLSVISEPEELGEIAQDWDESLVRNGIRDCSLTSHWIINFLNAFNVGERARILCARDSSGTIIGQAAFYLSRKAGICVLNSLTNDYANRSSIALAGDAHVIIGDWIRQQRVGFIRAGRFTPSKATHALFPNPKVSRGYNLPVIATETSFDAFLSDRSRNFRKSLKRANAKQERLRIETVDRPQDRVEDMLTVSRTTWKFDEGTAIASNASIQNFYAGIANANREPGHTQPMLFLIYDERDQPVAFLMGLIFNNVLFALKMGYDPRISDCFPGFALLQCITKFSFERDDVSMIDLDAVGAHGDYKTRWATETRELENIIGFPNSPLGLLSRSLWTTKQFLGRTT